MDTNGTFRRREAAGGTAPLDSWGADCEYGVLRDVLLGPPETFAWMADNAQYSSVVRATLRAGHTFDQQIAMRQHREMADAYASAGVTVHVLPANEHTPYQVYARWSRR